MWHMANKEEVVRLRLETDLKKKALKRAATEGRTVSGLLRWALIQYLSLPIIKSGANQ